jgi:hypothetical protein
MTIRNVPIEGSTNGVPLCSPYAEMISHFIVVGGRLWPVWRKA